MLGSIQPHGCIGCKRCPTHHCPICSPCRIIKNPPHPTSNRNVWPTIPNKEVTRHLHDWQELNTVIVCRICGEVKKK